MNSFIHVMSRPGGGSVEACVRTGIWLIGSRGSVAVSSVVGALAAGAGLAEPAGCVMELPALAGPRLPAWAQLRFGGHDIATVPLVTKARALADAGVVPARTVSALVGELADVEADLRPAPAGRTQADVVARASGDIEAFRHHHGLDRIVVVNVATTEPATAPHPAHADLDALRVALYHGDTVLPTSSAYAYAALSTGCSYVDFTPSTGARLPALAQCAAAARVPFAGHDAKPREVGEPVAPLVLDLARLTAAAHAAGRAGPLTPLAYFFADPLGDAPRSYATQWTELTDFVAALPR
jgi:myo-inositol-1-phosphate synthase